MKSKPIKHKSTNTFRFVPFAERINSIDIRHAALYHIEHAYSEQPEENETHFHLAIRKWHVLNLTENFKKFRKEVHGIVTVPQLVHKKEEVLEILERYLNLEDQLCLQPLLEVLVSLAKDLREDFYRHFPKFLDILIKLLNTKDAERLEWTLICLAFLFKILKPYLKKDIAVVLKSIVPLLSETKPLYINNFAAESFAFVARDIRDKKKFISLILNYLQFNDDAITGCGHLMFEIIKGVSGKFHSCIELFMPLLLQHLKENKEHQTILFKVLTQTIEDSLQSVSCKEFNVLWTSIFKYTEEILKDDNENKGLEYILRLAGQIIEHEKGKFLNNPPQFVLLLVKVICEQSLESVLAVCSQIGAVLLLSPNISLSQEHAGIIVKVLLPLPYPDILINFVQNIINYSQFDMHILPPFLNFVVQSDFDKDAISTLSKICLTKSPLSKSGITLFEWVKYPLDFGKSLPLFMENFNNVINEDLDEIFENPLKLMNVLFCLPHVAKVDVDICVKTLSEFISKLLKVISNYNLESQLTEENSMHNCKTTLSKCARKLLFILANTLECAIHISSCKKLDEICDINTLLPIILPCAGDPNYLVALYITDLYLTAYEQENGLKYSILLLVDSYLKCNITSPFHVVRLLTTHIYKLFENVEELKKTMQVGGNTENLSIFSMCYNVESILPSIQEYRSQLNILQKMSFNSTQYTLAKGTEFQLYPLNYMLGVLYINFNLLWQPVSEFIAGYGNSLTTEEFWSIFHKALTNSFVNAKKNLRQYQFEEEIETNCCTVKELYQEYNNINERPDVKNYRNLILNVMMSCVQVCEAKNRDVVILFLNFIEEEYKRNDHANVLKIDMEQHDQTAMQVDDVKPDEQEENIEEIPEAEEEKETVSGKVIFKTLINIMQVLAQFKNPRALYKEPVFWDLYMEFLKHKNPGLQKFALDCVLNYKNKSIVPYKNNLHNLVDDKKFKDELTQFKITEDSQNIRSEDREHVVPIILRILYGKMTSKLGADKKGGGQTRRALVMRYIAGCNQNELGVFIEMAFTHIKEYLNMEAKQIHETIVSNLDLKSVTNPGKLHSILNLFEVVREYFGGYMKEEFLKKLLKIFYTVISMVASVLAHGDKVHIGYIKVMKNIRTMSLTVLRKLFEQFEKYLWSKEELYIIFETLLWPLMPRLEIEGIHSPTALLRLFNVWCQNPRYYVLLITISETDTRSPLESIFRLLLAPKCHPVVVNMILDMLEKLLTLTEDAEIKEFPAIESFKTLKVDERNELNNINFGSKIIIPHISSILEVMKRRITNSAKSNTVNKRDLLIMSRVTELVTTPEMCDELLHLLLPILVKKVCMNMAEENMEHAITTIINLIARSNNPQIYIKNIAVLFNKVAPVNVRKLLIKLLNSIAESAPKDKEILTRLANVVTEMNAFNKRWIEQPDFDRRLDAYKKIYQLSENSEIDVELAILVVNNCFFFIKTEKDIGLRDGAGLCLKRILPKLFIKFWSTADGQFLVKDTVLSLISTGIRDTKNEILKNESINLLGELARTCPGTEVVLSDLLHLTNNDDREVDFFDNMCHLQMHRRVRALLKFCKVAKKMTKCPSPRTLTNFILPLATTYLCDDKYTEKNTLIDACIEVVSTCCRLLPWYHYEVILKLYLNKLRHSTDHQKQLTRLLIGILDAFHFDFSKVTDIDFPKELLSKRIEKQELKLENIQNNATEESDKTTDNIETKEDSEDNTIETVKDIETELKLADEENSKEVEVEKESLNIPAYERITIVSPSVAKRIIKSLLAGLLPQLNRTIGKMTDHDESHKLNRRRTGLERQEEDMLRVPIALALVKLLQRLPGDLLKMQFPGIIIKLCSFLKSPLKQVRIAARDIVKKIMSTVGTSYLGILLEHLTLLLTRGFQVHVLVATIHTVLDSLKDEFKSGELNENLHYILDVCNNDLFGALSEEKEVDKLHYKTPEAKPSKKSYVTLMIVSQNITEQYLINLLLPFKEVLQKHHSKKIVLKVQEALMHITSGLVTNKFLNMESLFVFLYGIASESIPEFVLGAPKRIITEAQKQKLLVARPNIFLVPEAPKRNREVQAKHVKTSSKANAHVLIEFSFNILYVLLKRERVPREECKAFVDPLVPLLVDALKSDHIKVATVALKCIASLWMIRISTPTLEEMIKDIVKTIFLILHKYATSEISTQNDNYNLVRTAFKAVTFLIRNVKYYTLEAEQLKTLLLYAEEDCQNDEKQANSFSLLKAILEGRLVSAELHDVMQKVAKICILSDSAKAREEARGLFVSYLTHYSPGKRLSKYLDFFLAQLNYELQHGRESSLKFLEMIINKLQVPQMSKHSELMLVCLGACLTGDAAPESRAAAAGCLEAMVRRLPQLERNKLFELTINFYQDNQPEHIELASQLCARFVNVEEKEFKNRLDTILPIISGKLLLLSNEVTVGRFVIMKLEQNDQTDEEKQMERDHSLIQLLNLIEKIVVHCSFSLNNKKYVSEYDTIAQQCQVLLAYPHAWVRLCASKILSGILTAVDAQELDLVARNKVESDRAFIYYETENALRSLILDLCAQYTPNVPNDMAEQVTAVLFQILKLVQSMSSFKLTIKSDTDNKDDAEGGGKVNIRWILFKLRKAVYAEVAKAPNCMSIRTSIFTMWMHLISILETEELSRIIDVLLPPIVRELSVGDAGAPASIAKQLAGRIGKKLRRKIGDLEYSKLVADVQTKLNIKRAERKKLLLQEKVNNPERAAKRKLQLKEKKKVSKKIKLEMLHGKRPGAKKRKAEVDIEDVLLQDNE